MKVHVFRLGLGPRVGMTIEDKDGERAFISKIEKNWVVLQYEWGEFPVYMAVWWKLFEHVIVCDECRGFFCPSIGL